MGLQSGVTGLPGQRRRVNAAAGGCETLPGPGSATIPGGGTAKATQHNRSSVTLASMKVCHKKMFDNLNTVKCELCSKRVC